MNDIYRDPVWELMDWFTGFPATRKIKDTGFKSVISRPHNLVNVKDAEGKVVAQRLDVCTTPFAKDDVKVKVSGDTLTVKCGAENIEDREDEEFVYRGISSQAYEFSLTIAPNVDKAKITAENGDGILRITLPLAVEPKPEEIEITVG